MVAAHGGGVNTLQPEPMRRCWRFADVVVDEASRQVQVRGTLVELQPRVWQLLMRLLERPGEVCDKDELLDSLWQRKPVSDGALTNCVNKLRSALDDRDWRKVLTAHAQGYRIGVPVTMEYRQATETGLRLAVGQSPNGRPEWRLLECLGSDIHGEAWVIEHRHRGDKRVLKFAANAVSAGALRREVHTLEHLRAACGSDTPAVELLGHGLDDHPAWLETEWSAQGSLAQYAARQGDAPSAPLAERLQWMALIAEAVEAAHRVGVLHEDLKASDLLIHAQPDGGRKVKLANWGRSQIPPQGRQSLSLRRRATDPPGDIHALGVLLYQCVVGDFRRTLESDWRSQVRDPRLLADIAAAVDPDPRARLACAASLSASLRAVCATGDLEA